MSIFSKLIVATLPIIPKPIVGYFAKPYIAGESLEDGVRVVKELNANGISATMDVLGESVDTKEDSLIMRGECEQVLHAINEHKLDATLSIKPTQLGLAIDETFCKENVAHLCEVAKNYGNSVCIDMEDHPYTDSTLRIYDELRQQYPENVTTVLQAYMRRTADDLRDLVKDGKSTSIRLCKGIYVEPEKIAYKDKQEIRENYKQVLRIGVDGGAFMAIATHDDELLEDGQQLVQERELAKEKYEFQMLLGVKPATRDGIAGNGHPMRVYVPFGSRWYAYSTRRLKENPNMALHIVRALFRWNN